VPILTITRPTCYRYNFSTTIRAGRSQLLEYLEEVVRPSMPILPYDEEASRWHGTARALLEREGRPTPFADGQIASIARTRDLTVVTENTSDFEPFETLGDRLGGIRVENWFMSEDDE
jgi:tRNA(fMet)-specific endonuclease VapC